MTERINAATVKAFGPDWRTTITGLLVGLSAGYESIEQHLQAGHPIDRAQLILAVGAALVGYLAKDGWRK